MGRVSKRYFRKKKGPEAEEQKHAKTPFSLGVSTEKGGDFEKLA